MADSGEKRPLGFDALAQEEEGAGYTVKFSSTEHESPEPALPVEEINLLETGDKRTETDAEKVRRSG